MGPDMSSFGPLGPWSPQVTCAKRFSNSLHPGMPGKTDAPILPPGPQDTPPNKVLWSHGSQPWLSPENRPGGVDTVERPEGFSGCEAHVCVYCVRS